MDRSSCGHTGSCPYPGGDQRHGYLLIPCPKMTRGGTEQQRPFDFQGGIWASAQGTAEFCCSWLLLDSLLWWEAGISTIEIWGRIFSTRKFNHAFYERDKQANFFSRNGFAKRAKLQSWLRIGTLVAAYNGQLCNYDFDPIIFQLPMWKKSCENPFGRQRNEHDSSHFGFETSLVLSSR